MNSETKGNSPLPYTGFHLQPINGQWRPGKATKVLRDTNPYNGEVLAEIQQASRDDMEEAHSGAARAYPGWAALLPGERAGVMRRAAQVMEGRREEIVSWLIKEAGSTRIKANLEWEAVHAVMLEATTSLSLPRNRKRKRSRTASKKGSTRRYKPTTTSWIASRDS